MAKSDSGNDMDGLDAANLEPIDKRKMFVGGLSLDTDEDDMKNYFTQFGQVVHTVVKRDPVSGRSRCFGFVTFATSAALKKVTDTKEHLLKGRRIDPKPAEPRTGEEGILKIFVGGIDPNMSDEDLRAYFEKFGTVKNLEWPRDRMRNNQKKNFAFVEFEEERVVNDVVRNARQDIGGKMCDVRKAIPPAQKAMQNQQQGMGNMGMGMGGMGMDRNQGWGDFSSGYGQSGFGGAYDQYAAAAAAYGFSSPEQLAAYYQMYDPSSFYDPTSMAAYYGAAGYGDYSGAGASAFDYAAAAAGYGAGGYAAGFGGRGDMSGGDAYKNAGMRGSTMRGATGGTSPRAGFTQKPGGGMNGSGTMNRGAARGGYHPYRR